MLHFPYGAAQTSSIGEYWRKCGGFHFLSGNLVRSHTDDTNSKIVLISHSLYRINVRGATLNEILLRANVIYRGKLTFSWWYLFWPSNPVRSHSDDVSSEIVLISHSLYRMNIRGAIFNEILHRANVVYTSLSPIWYHLTRQRWLLRGRSSIGGSNTLCPSTCGLFSLGLCPGFQSAYCNL